MADMPPTPGSGSQKRATTLCQVTRRDQCIRMANHDGDHEWVADTELELLMAEMDRIITIAYRGAECVRPHYRTEMLGEAIKSVRKRRIDPMKVPVLPDLSSLSVGQVGNVANAALDEVERLREWVRRVQAAVEAVDRGAKKHDDNGDGFIDRYELRTSNWHRLLGIVRAGVPATPVAGSTESPRLGKGRAPSYYR